MYITLRSFPELKIKNINKLKLNKGLINISETKKSFNNLTLPLSTNFFYYGEKLNKTTNKLGYIETVMIGDSNFIDLVKDKSHLVNKLVKGSTSYDVDFYLYTNKQGNNYVIVVKLLDEKTHIKEVISMNGLPLTLAYDDIIIKDIEFKRRIGKTSLYIKENKVNKYEVVERLPIIKPSKVEFKTATNTNIGTLDVESYFDDDKNQSYVYALGFKAYKQKPVLFYIQENQTSEDLILTCINAMLIKKYNGFIFYVHNLGGYDAIFILGALHSYNEENNNYYKLDTVFRDTRILRLTISIKTKSGTIRLTLVDSYNLLQHSLDSLCKNFETEVVKGIFPYAFVKKSTLYYIGDTPSKHYFKNISDKEYELINKPD